MVKLRIAVVESPNAVDMFDGRSESEALVSCCKLIGHESIKLLARSRRDFRELCQYLGAADTRHAENSSMAPLVLHLSCHGNEEGLEFGADFVDWFQVVKELKPILENDFYAGRFALAISSCGSGSHSIDQHLEERRNSITKMPQYIFSIQKEVVHWPDALLGWSLLYHKLAGCGLDRRAKVQKALKEVAQGTGLRFSYHRWDDDQFLTYTPRSEG